MLLLHSMHNLPLCRSVISSSAVLGDHDPLRIRESRVFFFRSSRLLCECILSSLDFVVSFVPIAQGVGRDRRVPGSALSGRSHHRSCHAGVELRPSPPASLREPKAWALRGVAIMGLPSQPPHRERMLAESKWLLRHEKSPPPFERQVLTRKAEWLEGRIHALPSFDSNFLSKQINISTRDDDW